MITDELREWARNHRAELSLGQLSESALVYIADRIDREHRMAMEKVAAEVDALPMTDESMAEHGWVRLPVDADGVPIRMGDVVRYDNLGDHGEPFEVKEITYRQNCETEVGDGEQYGALVAITVRHHHAPTVEDVLTEFGIDWEHESDCEDRAALLKEYAEKLRLAEGVDE